MVAAALVSTTALMRSSASDGNRRGPRAGGRTCSTPDRAGRCGGTLGRHIEKLATPEMADGIAVAPEHVEHRHVPLLARLELLLLAHAGSERGRVAEIVAVVAVAGRGEEPQVAPAALVRKGENARQRRLRDDGETEAFARVPHCAVKAIEKMSAAGAGPFALRPEHEAVDGERVLAGREQLRHLHLDRLALCAGLLEDVVLGKLPAGRKRAALRGDLL